MGRIKDARKEKGNIILLGGDFNEPSHLDWKENTKNLWDHNGTVRYSLSANNKHNAYNPDGQNKQPHLFH